MTSKERFLKAMTGEIPDRVPVSADISNMIPAKRTKLPFWDIYFFNKYPLWKAYLKAADYFKLDPWLASCTGASFLYEEKNFDEKISYEYDRDEDCYIRKSEISTPAGNMTGTSICYRNDPPSPVEKLIKNPEEDFEKFKYLCQEPKSINKSLMDEIKSECLKRSCAFGVCIGYPGFQSWNSAIEGGIMPLSYLEMDNPALLESWFELDMANGTKAMELLVEYRPDYILFGGSGTITLASPQLAEKYALPALKKWSAIAKKAGIPTMLHSCGKSRVLVDMLVEETDIDCINPLEVAPMGDVDLAEVKKARGDQICLMGNLHTTEIMLNASPKTVERKAKECIEIAGKGGRFILSTGDQCGYNTPDENLFALSEAAQKYGDYDQKSGDLTYFN
jgi:hypothetical protein